MHGLRVLHGLAQAKRLVTVYSVRYRSGDRVCVLVGWSQGGTQESNIISSSLSSPDLPFIFQNYSEALPRGSNYVSSPWRADAHTGLGLWLGGDYTPLVRSAAHSDVGFSAPPRGNGYYFSAQLLSLRPLALASTVLSGEATSPPCSSLEQGRAASSESRTLGAPAFPRHRPVGNCYATPPPPPALASWQKPSFAPRRAVAPTYTGLRPGAGSTAAGRGYAPTPSLLGTRRWHESKS